MGIMNASEQQILEDFFASYTKLTEQKGYVLIEQDQLPDGIYFLKKGYVLQYTVSEKGEKIAIHIFRPGSFFPLSWICNNMDSPYTHETMTGVTLYRAPKDAVRTFLQGHPLILYDVTCRLMSGITGLRKRIESLIEKDARQRTIGLLLYFADIVGERKGNTVTLPVPFPHRELAAWLGLTRETTSLQVETLARQKFISYQHRRIIIGDIKTLQDELTRPPKT